MLDNATAYKSDWPLFATDVLNVSPCPGQIDILKAAQTSKRVAVKSAHAIGKDWVASVAALCFMYTNYPSKVICTAPTARQTTSIMMAEISKKWKNSKIELGGELLASKIKFADDQDWFLEAFKAGDKNVEAWTGYHSPNIMVIVTEASGIEDDTFNAIEGLLTGNSRLLLIGNPNRLSGTFYKAFQSSDYVKFTLSALDAPNVVAKKTLIPGQVDWDWVDDKVKRWAMRIDESEVDETKRDFRWENESGVFWYRPDDLFKVKVLGEFPSEDESQLIPMAWVEASFDRWREWKANGSQNGEPLKLGVDVAGMGRDKTVFVHRHGQVISQIERFSHSDHMTTAGRVKNTLKKFQDRGYIDTIGEGAGVYSRLDEQNVKVTSVKFSEGASSYSDFTGQRSFANMRSYCVDYHTLIMVSDGSDKFIDTIGDLHKKGPNNFSFLNHENGFCNGTTVKPDIKKEMIQITQRHSGIIEISKDHFVKSNGKYIKAGDLKIGDSIDVLNVSSNINIKENSKYNEDIAVAFGLFISDGYAGICERTRRGRKDTGYYWCIANTNLEYLKKAQTGILSLGYNTKITVAKEGTKNNKTFYTLVPDCKRKNERKDICLWFIENFYTKETTKKKKIPSWMFSEPDNIINAFIDGWLLGDGDKSCYARKGSIRIASNETNNVNGIKILCDRMGWYFSVYVAENFSCAQVTIRKEKTFKSKRCFRPGKMGRFSGKDISKIIELNNNNVSRKHICNKFKISQSYLSQILSGERKPKHGDTKESIKRISFQKDEITRIKNIGYRDCYDVTASGEFIANSFKIHNCYWAIRDALDPKFKQGLALPPDDELLEDLTSVKIKKLRSDGSIVLEEKEEIKKRLGRSPDAGDALANTFYPELSGWGDSAGLTEREPE